MLDIYLYATLNYMFFHSSLLAIHYNLYNKKTHIHKDEIYRLN